MSEPLAQPGHTRIRARALKNLSQYVASECLGIDAKEIEIKLHDSNTKLGVDVRAGIPAKQVQRLVQATDATLFTYADEIAKTYVTKLNAISGYEIGEANFSFDHIVPEAKPERRVK